MARPPRIVRNAQYRSAPTHSSSALERDRSGRPSHRRTGPEQFKIGWRRERIRFAEQREGVDDGVTLPTAADITRRRPLHPSP